MFQDLLDVSVGVERAHPRSDDVIETLAKARAYLETGGWTRVEDGLPVVLDGDNDVEIWIVFPSGLVDRVAMA